MTIAPIITSITIVRFAIVAALDPLTTSGVYWLEAPETAVRPFIVIQSQDSGGRGEPRLSSLGWSGLITVKAIADKAIVAENLVNTVAPGMDALVAPMFYDLTAAYVRPVVLPPSEGVHQAGHIWMVKLERE